jgi:predicted acetyltransferase
VDSTRIIKGEELDNFMRIVLNAYPRLAMPLEDEALGFEERVRRAYTDPSLSYIAFFRDNDMQGVMRCHDLHMNFHGRMIPVGGMGLLAVDLLHKKEHVAKKLMEHYHKRYLQKNNCMTIIYPFSTYFYKRMGYGYGSKMDQYRINPLGLPDGGSKQNVRYLTPGDADAVSSCHRRVCLGTHGMCAKVPYEIHEMLHTPGIVPVGYVKDNVLKGYVVFHFQRGFEQRIGVENRYINDMYIHEMVYEDRESLYGLLSFLRTQADQIGRIILRTQDEYFHHLLLDVSDGSQNIINLLYHQSNVSGVGVMYRIVDVKKTITLMGELDFGSVTLTVDLNIQDSFLPENSGSYTVALQKGRLKLGGVSRADMSLTIDISDFSSLLMGVVPLRRLMSYGYAELSDPVFLDQLDRLFISSEKPVCYTGF